MASKNYMLGRQPYSRPQGMLWSDQGPQIDEDGFAFPPNYEYLSSLAGGIDINDNTFIILSDHNRSPIQISTRRIDQKVRTANGAMRSYFVADKQQVSVSWTMLPSRSFGARPNFNQGTGLTTLNSDLKYTADGGAGAAELKMWNDTHRGGFWVYLAYDNYAEASSNNVYTNLNKYTDFYFMTITEFNFSVVKRGANNHDLWDVSVTLEEV